MLQNPDMEKELRRELQPLYAQNPTRIPSVRELEKLPYLTGCIKEGLRCVLLISIMSKQRQNRTDSRGSIGGNLGRLGRVSPDAELHFQSWIIPRGVSFFGSLPSHPCA
jgi:Cytochrome P450